MHKVCVSKQKKEEMSSFTLAKLQPPGDRGREGWGKGDGDGDGDLGVRNRGKGDGGPG